MGFIDSVRSDCRISTRSCSRSGCMIGTYLNDCSSDLTRQCFRASTGYSAEANAWDLTCIRLSRFVTKDVLEQVCRIHTRNKALSKTYVCMHVSLYVCMHVRMRVCMYVCMYACMYVCMDACKYQCMCKSTYMSMYACMYATFGAVEVPI